MDSMNTGQYENCSHIPCKDEERVTEEEFHLGLKVVFIGDRSTIDGIKGTVLQPPHCADNLFRIPKNAVPQFPQLSKRDSARYRTVLQLPRRTYTSSCLLLFAFIIVRLLLTCRKSLQTL